MGHGALVNVVNTKFWKLSRLIIDAINFDGLCRFWNFKMPLLANP
ncbi:hypothetical protein [Nostoc linckia]|nr:hypothetical protein [Nostoc linckia]